MGRRGARGRIAEDPIMVEVGLKSSGHQFVQNIENGRFGTFSRARGLGKIFRPKGLEIKYSKQSTSHSGQNLKTFNHEGHQGPRREILFWKPSGQFVFLLLEGEL
jgi:hypothetical protein